jgi:hypothetical protein
MSVFWWAIDESDGRISPLPASPLLLPAVGVFAFIALCASIARANAKPEPLKTPIDPAEYQRNSAIYHELMMKKRNGIELTIQEVVSLEKAQHPSWAEPGERWFY